MAETFWNGEHCDAEIVLIKVGPAAKPTFWHAGLEGTERFAVEVRYGGQTFYLDNEDGDGWYKVTKGRGSPRCGHKSIPVAEVITRFGP